MGRKAYTHWYSLYVRIKPELRDYSGEESVNAYIEILAKKEGYAPKALKRMLSAGDFLEQSLGPQEPSTVKCGYAHLEIMERLEQADPSTSWKELLRSTLEGKVTAEELRGQLKAILDREGSALTRVRSDARTRVISHDQRVYSAISEAGPALFGHPSGELIRVTNSELFGPCYLIKQGNTIETIIFSRVGDTSRRKEKALSELIRHAFGALRVAPIVWYIFPPNSHLATELPELAHLIPNLGVMVRAGVLQPHKDVIDIHPPDRLSLDVIKTLSWAGDSLTQQKRIWGRWDFR